MSKLAGLCGQTLEPHRLAAAVAARLHSPAVGEGGNQEQPAPPVVEFVTDDRTRQPRVAERNRSVARWWQVLPFSAGEHSSLAGSFNCLRFEDDPDLVYTEDLISGHMTAAPDTIREAARRCAHLQAAALSVEDSAALITRVMEEQYGDRPRPEERAVA